MANLVEYVKTVWENGKTALNAARMNNMEQGISNCATQINKLGDSVYRIKTGSQTFRKNGTNNEIVLFTKEQFKAICGREYNQNTDFVGVSSGDKDGIGELPISTAYSPTTGNIIVKLTDGNSQAVRINYLIVLS